MDWPEAESLPYLNVVGDDPQLRDPEHGDYRPAEGSPAEAYGCQTFAAEARGTQIDARPIAGRGTEGRAGGAPATARLEVSGELTVDTLWDADTIAVTGDVGVADGVTLSIVPGVRVEFAGPYRLDVQGRVLALGEPEERIVFTSAHPEAFAVDSTQTGCWHGIHFEGTPAANADSRFSFCVFEYAKGAGEGARGGAMTLAGAVKLELSDCVFRRNVADYGAALFCSHFAAPRLTGCLLTENTAFVGGAAIFAMDAYPKLAASTIALNPVLNADVWYATGVVHNHIAKSQVTGNVIWANANEYFLSQQIREGKVHYVTYNDIELGHAGEGNLDQDPLFADQGEHPFALLNDSPCVDAGPADTTGLRLPPFDLSGATRLHGARVDMGAYEWRDPAAVPGIAGSGGGALREPLALRALGGAGGRGAELRFTLDEAACARLTIHDAAGRLVAEPWEGELAGGAHCLGWTGLRLDGAPAASGLYLCRLQAGDREGRARLLWLPAR